MPNLGSLLGSITASDAARKYEKLRTDRSAEDVQSAVGLAREGYKSQLPGHEDASDSLLAQLDRMSQGELYGLGARIAQPGTPGAPAINAVGYLASLPGAVVGATANEVSKAIPGGQKLAGAVARLTGGDESQFKVADNSSQPSVANIAALLRGHARGVFGSAE